jgi:hypothetical protein
MHEPGLDRHAWATEWEALEPLVVDSPAEALPELDDLVERMMVESGYPIDEAGARQSGEPEVVAEFLEARRITLLLDSGQTVDPGDVGAAITAYRNLYEHLLQREIDLD